MDKKIPQISVIIPCYNSQKTIQYSLWSLEQQTYKNFEVIVVNDGSKDNTLKVIENYRKKSLLSIRLLTQENAGVSVARNTGILNAKGIYITFLDADDRYDNKFLEYLYNAVNENEVDFAFCKYLRVENEKEKILHGDSLISKEYCSKFAMLDLYSHKRKEKINMWGGIYRQDILKKYNIFFPVGIKYGEDTQFFCQYVYCCNRGGIYIKAPLYGYTERYDSVTHSIDYDIVQNIEVYKKVGEYWNKDKMYSQKDITYYMVNRAIWGVAKDFALVSDNSYYRKLQEEYPVKNAMSYMVKFADETSIRVSASAFCIHPLFFIYIIKVYSKLQILINNKKK